jgi:transposase
VRSELKPFYSTIGRPSIDPELMMRMLIVGYCMGIRSERRLCEEVHLNLAYSWFCRLGLDGKVPVHSTFSRNRHGRFRQSNILRHLFETVVERCLREGLVGGEGFVVDASLIAADANKQRSVPGEEWRADADAGRAVQEYLTTLITKEGTRIYRASKRDCDGCALKASCGPNTPAHKIPRDLDEDARDAARALVGTPAYERSRHRRKKVEMLFAHLKRILQFNRLRLREPCGARDEFLLAATAQNLRKLARLRAMTVLA